MLPVERELAALKFLDGLAAHLRDVREPHKALRHALRDTREFFQATHGCIATLHAGRPEADLLFTLPKHADWDLRRVDALHPPHPSAGSARHADRLRCGGAAAPGARSRWSAPGSPYDREDRRLLTRIAAALSGGRPPDRPRPAPGRARPDRPEDHGADPPEGSLLSDPGRHPVADPLRSLVRAADPRGGRGGAARRGGADRLDEGEEPADRAPAPDDRRCGGAAAIGTGLRLRSPRRQLAGMEDGQPAAGLASLLDYNSDDGGRRRRTFGRRRCCARRWSPATAWSAS